MGRTGRTGRTQNLGRTHRTHENNPICDKNNPQAEFFVMNPIHVLIPIAIFLLTACASQSDLDAANARTAQAQQDAAVAEQRAHDAGARADAVSFQKAVTSDSAVLAILVVGVLGLVVILAISAPSIGESHAQARRDRLREFELENERARIMLDAKRLQMQQRQQTQAKQLPSADRRVVVCK